jgi:hypothetical protein
MLTSEDGDHSLDRKRRGRTVTINLVSQAIGAERTSNV